MRFSVLVVGPAYTHDLQDVLMPYYEHADFDPYIKFTREDKAAEKKRLKRYWGKKLRENPHDVGIFNKYEIVNISDEEYFFDQTKHYKPYELNENGEPISTYNPNSRWNSWEYDDGLISRYTYTYKAALKKKAISWSLMAEYGHNQAHINWHTMFSPGFPAPTMHEKAMNNYWEGETKEQYMGRSRFFLTHAYILHGKWYERGRIGWWEDDDSIIDRDKWLAQYEKMLTQTKANTVLTTIECNI